MKKYVIAIILTFSLVASVYAVNPVDLLMCKEVTLRCGGKKILASLITGEVKYAIGKSGQWVPVTGPWKRQLQTMYDIQRAPEIEFARY